MSEELTIAFTAGTTGVGSMVAAVVRAVEGTILQSEHYELYGKRVRADQVGRFIQARDQKAFHLTGERLEAHYNSLPRYGLDMVSVKDLRGEIPNPDDIVVSLSTEGEFIMAWVADSEYDYWQNADTIAEAAGREHWHLPKISNGLPPPLQDEIIDVSHNPGRRALRQSYVEAVASRMWLSDKFFLATGADQAAVLKRLVNVLKCHVGHSYDYVELRCGDGPFKSAEGESGRLQRELRSLLYPQVSESQNGKN